MACKKDVASDEDSSPRRKWGRVEDVAHGEDVVSRRTWGWEKMSWMLQNEDGHKGGDEGDWPREDILHRED